MRFYMMQYPGDPPLPVVQMTQAEFLTHFPKTPTVLIDLDTGDREEFPMGDDEILCDLCNDYVGVDGLVYVLNNSRAYCESCALKGLMPYSKELRN